MYIEADIYDLRVSVFLKAEKTIKSNEKSLDNTFNNILENNLKTYKDELEYLKLR